MLRVIEVICLQVDLNGFILYIFCVFIHSREILEWSLKF